MTWAPLYARSHNCAPAGDHNCWSVPICACSRLQDCWAFSTSSSLLYHRIAEQNGAFAVSTRGGTSRAELRMEICDEDFRTIAYSALGCIRRICRHPCSIGGD